MCNNGLCQCSFNCSTATLFSHIARIWDETDVKKILTASPLENWKRPPGHPCTTWLKTIQQDMNSNNLPEWSNRHGWESSTLETDVYVWRYALLVVLAIKEDTLLSLQSGYHRMSVCGSMYYKVKTVPRWMDWWLGFYCILSMQTVAISCLK